MRELTGNLVAGSGAEQSVARTVADVSQQFQCGPFFREQFLRKEHWAGHAPIADGSIGADVASDRASRTAHPMTNDVLTDRAHSGAPITVFYAEAVPAFGMLD
jgi:hypothetical protein